MLDYPETPDDGVYHLFALRYARQSRQAKDNFMPSPMAGSDPHDGPMPSSYYIWIIRNRFRTIIVDSGISPRAAIERGRRTLDHDPIEALSRLGVDPDAVEDVIITHLHFDHASNIHRFDKARFHIQEAEAAFTTGPCMCQPFLRAPFDIEDIVTLMRRLYADRVVFHNGEANPFPGVSLHVLPGHSAGIQAVRVMTPRGPVVLASDTTHYYVNVLRNKPFRVTIDVAATLRSFGQLMKIAGSADRIIPGHDPKVRAIYPRIDVNGIEVIKLHEPPMDQTEEDLIRVDAE